MVADLTAAALAEHVASGGLVVDVREPAAYADAHVRGSLNVALSSRSAPYWLYTLVAAGTPLVAVTAFEGETAYVEELVSVAERELGGSIAFDRDTFAAAGLPLASVRLITPDELADERGLAVLDVREAGEWLEAHVPDAVWIPLDELSRRLQEVPPSPLAVICASGFRSSIGASLLERAGRDGLANVWGGTTAWEQLGLPVRGGRAS